MIHTHLAHVPDVPILAQTTDSATLDRFPVVGAFTQLMCTAYLPRGPDLSKALRCACDKRQHPIETQEKPVAANCDVCGKGPGFGHSISHSHRRTKRRWNPNIQRIKALVGVAGVTPKRLNVCTSCLKAGKVKR